MPDEVDCGHSKPGVRCRMDPCEQAACPGVPGSACVPFSCQEPRRFRGVHIVQRPCSAVFVDPDFGNVVDCSTAAQPLRGHHRTTAGDNGGSSGGEKTGSSGTGSAVTARSSGSVPNPADLPPEEGLSRAGFVASNGTAATLQSHTTGIWLHLSWDCLLQACLYCIFRAFMPC